MNETHREWTDRFSDYLSDELDTDTRAELERHVAGCGACRKVLAELRDVVARAHGLDDRQPSKDLWPGIAAAIDTPVRPRAEEGARVIALPTARNAAAVDGRIAFTAPQLVAASVALIAISVAATSWAGPGLGTRADADASAIGADRGGVVEMVSTQPTPPEALSGELASLEEVLDAARASLDPNTVRVIERNLAVIEQAIADSHQALALDPENEFLAHHLERVYERKVEYLRDAARVLAWAG